MPKMDVAHIHQTARIGPDEQALLADVKGSVKPDGQQSPDKSNLLFLCRDGFTLIVEAFHH